MISTFQPLFINVLGKMGVAELALLWGAFLAHTAAVAAQD